MNYPTIPNKLTNRTSFPHSNTPSYLKALLTTAVSTLSVLSLHTSAQAASFVTTLDTQQGPFMLEWSGSDANGDDFIDLMELSGPVTLIDGMSGGTISSVSSDFFSIDSAFFFSSVQQDIFSVQVLDDQTGDVIFFDAFLGQFGTGFLLTLDGSFDVISQQTQLIDGGGSGEVESTPEPTLTLGLITLGGLMLGSRKKEKA